jgi:glycosyltransferase involved in cell wall biosynthesis
MKTISIFAVPSHQTRERTSGVDFARVIQPMKHLDGYSDGKYKFKVDIYDIFEQEEYELKSLKQYLNKSGGFWKEKATKYDLVFFNYTAIDWHYASMATFVHGMGKKLILDLDDALWNVNPDNIAHDSLKQIGAGDVISAIIKDVDGITTTNLYLKNLIHHKTGASYDKMATFPNAIDLKLYNHKSPTKDSNPITLFHYGSSSHFEDLLEPNFVEGISRIFRDYPNVVFKAIGANIPKLKAKWGERYSYTWGHSDIYHWIADKFPVFMDEADIMVVPLSDNIYNICKSDIKFLETATATKPGVFSDIRPYRDTIEDGITGFIAGTPDKWYESLKILIDSKEKREEIGNNAYKYIVKERQIEKLVPQYAEFILKVLGLDKSNAKGIYS